MNVKHLLEEIHASNIDHFIGVPDSTLKVFCDYLNQHVDHEHHYVPVNEGAAVALGAGLYLGTKKPTCIYMQNSGIGNAINPIASLINEKVYDIPMLFLIGYRGEPGQKDEPQHKFQGEITLPQLSVLNIAYDVLSKETTQEQLQAIFSNVRKALQANKQYALVIKKGTFEKQESSFNFENPYTILRETAIQHILEKTDTNSLIVSTTGKISREVYEQSDALFHNHDNVFLTVGSMGHCSMIALGLAKSHPEKTIYCLDGDGAALMHMGSMAFLSQQKCTNMMHIVLNNNAHESVGGMPTDCQTTQFVEIAKAAGYQHCYQASTLSEVDMYLDKLSKVEGTKFLEIQVMLGSRDDLGRPKESAVENKEKFMEYIHRNEEN